MSRVLTSLKLCLLLLSGAGFYTMWYLSANNGTLRLMVHVRDVGPQILPGTTASLKTSYTGIKGLDHELTVLTIFFWQLVDGSYPNGSLLGFHFAGQIAAGWGLFLIESLRSGNRKRLISFLTVWGLLVQAAGFHVVMPLYLALQLSTSPTVSSYEPSHYSADLPNLLSIPFSIAIGLILPTILAALPAPSVISFDQKQAFMASWQAFPLWVGLLQLAIPHLITKFYPSRNFQKPSSSKKEWLSISRVVYLFLLTLAATTHIATLTLCFTSTFLPGLFAPEYNGVFSLSNVFWPTTISAAHKISSIKEGALLMMQYDEILASLAVVLWASVLFTTTFYKLRKVDTAFVLFLDCIGIPALFGPVGFAIICVWGRDELVLEERSDEPKKTV